jgi:PIN domain
VYVFLDTMIFLHCADLESIDFTEVLGTDSVTIVVPRITIRELDGHKTNHTSSRIRNRARSALTKIELLVADAKPIRPNVSLQLMNGLPQVDYAGLGLEPAWNDDQLIASALTFANEKDTTVTVITHDTGARLKCKQIGLKAISLPDKYQLPEELDPRDDEIRKLKRELQRLESAMPKLAVYFSGTTESTGRFQLDPPIALDESLIQSVVDDARNAIADAIANETEPHSEIGKFNLQFALVPQSEVERYRKECKEYPNRIKAYETAKLDFANQVRRAFRFTLEVCNFGSAPADDVDIHLHFPDGFQLLEVDDLPKEPRKPSKPQKPRTEIEMTLGQIRVPMLDRIAMPNIHRQMSSFKLKRTNSYDVKDHFHSIKHGDSAELPELYLLFDTFETAKSFYCEFELRVANLPDKLTGQLHFIVDTTLRDGG